MNTASVSCSSEERGPEENNWVCESWGNPASVTTMSVGLENARQFQGRIDWDWDGQTVNNPLLLSHHHHRHHHNHHQQQHHHHRQGPSDSEEQKPQLMPPHIASFRQYTGMGMGMGMGVGVGVGVGYSAHHHQNVLGLTNSTAIRSIGGSNDGISSSSSFHPSLLYTEMPGFGYESRSQLMGNLMSMQEQQHKENGAGTLFHDIVKREDVCAGEFQARIGLNLGHRTYFSSEDNAVSRLYKRPRAVPPASQVPRCQAEGCKADLSSAKHYHRRHKVCEFHSKANSVVTGGQQQRFCQQCSRFHVLTEFDESKRSCRKRLADHNRRRRKPQPNAVVTAASNAETLPATAVKAEDENNNKNNGGGQGGNDTRGLQAAQSQAFLNAMSMPPMLQNSKAQTNPNPNVNSNGSSNVNPNPCVLQTNSQKVSAAPCQQQQQYAGHKGPNLSMGLCNQRQATQQEYSGLELALPWLRPSSEYSGSHHRPSPPMDILMSDKADVEGFSSSIQNFLPLSASKELGTSSQWMVGSSADNNGGVGVGVEGGQQQMFSLLESPAGVVRTEDSQPPVEYLSHRRHQRGGLKDSVESDAAKFSDMQSLRPFGQSIYDSSSM